jgi:hypothetical protein
MALITPEYKALQSKFHIDRPDYRVTRTRHVDIIQNFAQQMKTRDILDYGCGKCMLQKGLPFPIQNYDPCNPEYDVRPTPAAIVVCTDVLEHIEPDCLKDVLDDLKALTKQMIFLNVSCVPAKKFLPDGRNAHIIQESPNWWLSWLLPRFNLHSFQVQGGEFTAIMIPPQVKPEVAE